MKILRRLTRKYNINWQFVISFSCLFFAFIGYLYFRDAKVKEVEGSTLSLSNRRENNDLENGQNSKIIIISPTPTQPNLVVPTIIQINIYVSNTTPIYNDFYKNVNATNINITPTATPTATTNPSPTGIPTTPTATPTIAPLVSSFTGKYFNNKTLTGTPVLTRTDSRINFDWGNSAPDSTINADIFSIRWEGIINSTDANYQLTTRHDDAMRIYIDDQLIHNHWSNSAAQWEISTIDLKQGTHTLIVEYYENSGGAYAYFDMRKL